MHRTAASFSKHSSTKKAHNNCLQHRMVVIVPTGTLTECSNFYPMQKFLFAFPLALPVQDFQQSWILKKKDGEGGKRILVFFQR